MVERASLENDAVLHFANALAQAANRHDLLGVRHRSRIRLSPSLSYGRHLGPPCPTAKQAAVMICIEAHSSDDWEDWTVPLTVRSQHLPDHPGQISLPGGRLEMGESHEDAAIRETCEELGLERFPGAETEMLHPIYVYNSNYYVQPFVTVFRERVVYVPCRIEVARLLHVPLRVFMLDETIGDAAYQRQGIRWTAPAWRWENDTIWGATAIILADLAALLRSLGSSELANAANETILSPSPEPRRLHR